MEKLKSLVPDSLKRMVAESTPDSLPRTCSSLLNFFSDMELFHQMVRDLTDPERAFCGKNKDAALELKQKGNQCFLNEDYGSALTCYSEALRLAPVDVDDMDKNLVAALYVNRASVLHKLDLLMEGRRDCNRALQISPSYAKAWYRRGKMNASLGNFEDAVHDLNIAKNLELSFGGQRQIESELRIITDMFERTESSLVQHKENELDLLDEPDQIKLKCVITPNKGRGMVAPSDIPPASLVHAEEPYALLQIISKHCRETHCHYCLNDLPPDKVSCTSCSIPLYCSQRCQIRAGGQMLRNHPVKHGIQGNISHNLDTYISEITLGNDSESDVDIPEHKHECQGVHWPTVFPSEIALAGRALIKSLAERSPVANFVDMLNLSQNYPQIHPESKLELHIYSIILLYCLQHSSRTELLLNGASIAQIVILISQIRVNSMTIFRMKSADVNGPLHQFGKFSHSEVSLTSNVEQVKVGQAIYRVGSLFNHSCQPNIGAYFVSRSLFIRTTEFVAVGCPLELSYGPQAGQWDCKDRLKFLKDEYSFRCECRACAEVNLSDLVLNAFHCVSPNCPGIVLDSCVVNCEKQKTRHVQSATGISTLEPFMQVDMLKCLPSNGSLRIDPGFCLKCDSYCDLESSFAAVNRAWISITRLKDTMVSGEISTTVLTAALNSLCLLRSTLHAYNKRISEVEDNLAEAFCLVGELQLALDHCKASIEILEKLYGPNHIVIGYELVKLSSIQLSMGDRTAVKNINRVSEIFSRYYGSHADKMFPYLQPLQGKLTKLVQ
ncbi:hypothetical protein F2P56_017372 [Juglans regia]|uniref:SET and MYND domain-containing protein 4 isoform X3 n=2 Tax=Juglans regia TaxID=51240 RepID=A0A2I4FPD6_JUGRE|nr:SET and MYND domain-containing protein 4 isoform X3 [Juglans regia]KAF5467557.1 hypothetical protein F2P56_017372 [Juglans regia]